MCCIQPAAVVAEKLHEIDPKVNEGGVKVLAEGFEDVVAGCADDAFMCPAVCMCVRSRVSCQVPRDPNEHVQQQ